MNFIPKEFLILSIGPIQSFISASRRTQDLAASSLLLSWLAREALMYAEQKLNAEIIYPQKPGSDWPDSLPNRIVMLLEDTKGKTAGEGLTKYIIEDLWEQQVGSKIKDYIDKIPALKGHWDTAAQQQFKQFLEVYWIASSWNGNPASYGDAYRRASLGFDARKSLRNYPTSEQPGWKCSLCGIRSALGREQARQVWASAREQRSRILMRSGERLCTVCSVKRFGQLADLEALKNIGRFPSTSKIATTVFRQGITNSWSILEECAQEFMLTLKELNLVQLSSKSPDKQDFLALDGDFFFEDFYRSPGRIKELCDQLLSASDTQRMITSLRKLIRLATEKADVSPPGAYYAILALDGDHMGRLLDIASSKDDHQNISKALARAAEEMRSAIENIYNGYTIYCGGDDALALLPTDKILSAANQLRQKFEGALNHGNHPGRTASAAIVISHHQAPLGSAIEQVHTAEADAKNIYNRNALVLQVFRRSGEPRQAGMKWDDQVINTLELVQDQIANNTLSNKFAYEFQEEALELPEISSLKARRLELKRLLKRHSNLDETALEQLAGQIEALVAKFIDLRPEETYNEQLGQWLVMMRFLAQEA